MDPTQIGIAIIMVGVAVASMVWLKSNMAAASARRMMGMMKRIGLDHGTVSNTLWDPKTMTIGKELRRRCRRCPREALCERWLAGEVKGGNSFCPNAESLAFLKERRQVLWHRSLPTSLEIEIRSFYLTGHGSKYNYARPDVPNNVRGS